MARKYRPANPSRFDIIKANFDLLPTFPNAPPGGFDACWACGNGEPGFKATKAHVVAYRNGGSMDPSNFFLLCELCHEEQPDGLSREFQLDWIRNRESFITRFFRLYGESLKAWAARYEERGGTLEHLRAFMNSSELAETLTYPAHRASGHANALLTVLWSCLEDGEVVA